jgi:hypothetical protein
MPTYAPTVKERKIVEKAAGFGLPHDKICQLIVSERTGKPIPRRCVKSFASSWSDKTESASAPIAT